MKLKIIYGALKFCAFEFESAVTVFASKNKYTVKQGVVSSQFWLPPKLIIGFADRLAWRSAA